MADLEKQNFEPEIDIVLQNFFVDELALVRSNLVIDPALGDDVVRQNLGFFRQFIEKAREHRPNEAVESFKKGASFLDQIGNKGVVLLLFTLYLYMEALNALVKGDIQSSQNHLNAAKQNFRGMSATFKTWEIYADTLEAEYEVLVARMHINVGDIDRAIASFKRAENLFDSIESRYDATKIDNGLLSEIYGISLEVAVWRSFAELSVMNYEQSAALLDAIETKAEKIRVIVGDVKPKLQQNAISSIVQLYDALHKLAHSFLATQKGNQQLSASSIHTLALIRDDLIKLKETALAAENKGMGVLNVSKQLVQLIDNYAIVNKPRLNGRFGWLQSVTFIVIIVAGIWASDSFSIGDLKSMPYLGLLFAIALITSYGKGAVDIIKALSALNKSFPNAKKENVS